jgi:hypothetical protein
MQTREAVMSLVIRRRLAQSSPHVVEHCPAEMWNVKLPERGAVP